MPLEKGMYVLYKQHTFLVVALLVVSVRIERAEMLIELAYP
jgi:hypothetical protein